MVGDPFVRALGPERCPFVQRQVASLLGASGAMDSAVYTNMHAPGGWAR